MRVGIALEKKIIDRTKWDTFKIKAVKLWTRSEYYHTEFIFDEFWVSATTKGIVRYDLQPLNSNYDYYFIDIDITERHFNILKDFVDSQALAKYDWTGIWLSQFAGIGTHREDKWFCSELVVKLMQISLIEESLPLLPHMLSPADVGILMEEMHKAGRVEFIPGDTFLND